MGNDVWGEQAQAEADEKESRATATAFATSTLEWTGGLVDHANGPRLVVEFFSPDGLLMPRGIRAFATGPQMLHIPQKGEKNCRVACH